MCARNFTPEEFGRFHPGGQLGRNLRLSVAAAMHTGDEVAWVAPETALKDVIIAMTRRPMGGACVVEADGTLAGFLTDGDLRRALTSHDDIRTLRAADAMTATPVTVGPDASLGQALELMERRRSQISVLPVVDGEAPRARAAADSRYLPRDAVARAFPVRITEVLHITPCIPLELQKSYTACRLPLIDLIEDHPFSRGNSEN